jgi:hypothetical protein
MYRHRNKRFASARYQSESAPEHGSMYYTLLGVGIGLAIMFVLLMILVLSHS